MRDLTPSGPLPTPDPMRNYSASAKAAWQIRRLRESSRGVITGNVAFIACLLGTILVVLHSDWFDGAVPFVMFGVLFVYLACLLTALRWIRQPGLRSPAAAVDRSETKDERAGAQPVPAVVFLIFFGFQALATAVGVAASRLMSPSALLATLAAVPVLAAGFFVRRFVVFRFWEDLLFAASVVTAYTPFFLRAWRLTPLSSASLAAVSVGTVCLHRRWLLWARTPSPGDMEGAAESGDPEQGPPAIRRQPC